MKINKVERDGKREREIQQQQKNAAIAIATSNKNNKKSEYPQKSYRVKKLGGKAEDQQT